MSCWSRGGRQRGAPGDDPPRPGADDERGLVRRLRRDGQRDGPAQPARAAPMPVLQRSTWRRRIRRLAIPSEPGIVPTLLDVMPVHAVVPVDFYLPGCPPPGLEDSERCLEQLLEGETPNLEGRQIQVRLRRWTRVTRVWRSVGNHDQADRHRPGDPDRGARQDHRSTSTTTGRWPTRDSTWRSSAASRSSARGVPSGRCRGSPRGSAASARSATCWPRPRPATRILAVDHPAGRREAAAADEPRPDRPVARAELLPPERARPAAGHGHRPRRTEHLRPDRGRARAGPRRASACGSSARRSSSDSGAKKIHPAWSVPGGVRGNLSTREPRPRSAPGSPRRRRRRSLPSERFKGLLDRFHEEAETFGNFPTLFLGLVGPDGAWEHYGGQLRFVDAEGTIVADGFDARRLPGVHRRGRPARLLPEIALLPPARLPGRDLSRRPAGPAQHLHAHGHAAGRPGTRRVPPARRADRHLVVLVSLRPPDRDPRRHRAHRAHARRPRPALRPAPAHAPGSIGWRASG